MTPEQTAARAKRESIEKKRRTEKNVRSFAGAALVSDRATVERADEDEDKMTVPPAAESTPTIGPLPVGGLSSTSNAVPSRDRCVELVQEPARAASAAAQQNAATSIAPVHVGGCAATPVTLMQSSGTVCAVQSEDVINRAEIINAVGSRLVDMYSSTQPGWETMTNAMVEKVFGKFAVDAITADRPRHHVARKVDMATIRGGVSQVPRATTVPMGQGTGPPLL
ncbi:hypothetical protein PInf_002764 [Phytophthora infestans]|nr:hypothetical protein PInf_002764 [Phytophthora infestans]